MKQRKLEKDSNVILKDEEEKSKESPKPNAFMIIWLGQLISLIGTDITKFALRIKTYQDTGSVTQYGFLTFFSEMPAMLLSPFAGVIVDRYPRKYIMMVADAATASTTLGLALLYYYGTLHIGHIYIANIVGSICNAFQWTAFTASVPLIVPKDQLTKVGGMSQAAPALSMLVGPGLSGLLLGYFDLNVIFLIEFVTFLIAVMATSSTEIPRPPKGKEVKGTVKKEVLNALQYIWERKGLFALICFSSIGHFSNGLSQVLFTPLLLNFSRATVVGSVLSISGTGALLGSSVLSLWGGPKRKVYGVLGVGFVQGLLFACSGLIPNAYFIFFVGFMYMSFIPLLRVCRESLWQRKVPPGLLGRILAIQKGISQAAIPIAAVLGGIVADTIFEPLMEENAVLGKMLGAYLGTGPGRGVGLMFIVVGLFNATVAALAFMYKPLRYLDTDLPDMI